MKLFIVESPGKVKKIQGFLGNDYKVMASVGHFRDLPKKEMGVATQTDFKATYVVDPKKEIVVQNLIEAVKNAQEVFLATDPDREGEAIAWHLKEVLNVSNPKRVTYTEITEKAVKDGIENARTIDMDLVLAQETRRVLDRFCGYMVSDPLSKAAGEAKLSAGRVQSPALRLVVELEQKIKSFVSTTHYGVELTFDSVENITKGWKALWLSKPWLKENEEYILDKALAEKISKIDMLEVSDFKEADSFTAPPTPFITLTLLQAASIALKFKSKDTTQLAQKLYEKGVITYIRTDFPNLSADFVAEARAYCEAQGLELVDQPRTFKSKDTAQEAHEAIRPIHIEDEIVSEDDKEQALYTLIRNRTLATQLADAVFSVRKATFKGEVDSKEVIFEATGRTLVKPGWKSLVASDQTSEDETEEPSNPIPSLQVGQKLKVTDSKLQTKKTAPPIRYSDASLFKELEKRGIGRPSTYSAIFEVILFREYIKVEKNKLVPTPKGELVIANLKNNFGFVDYEFTKEMEANLDKIAEGKETYLNIVSQNFKQLTEEVVTFKKIKGIQEITGLSCPECNSSEFKHILKAKTATHSGYDFFACDACKATFPNVDGKPGAKQEKKKPSELTEFKCLKCKKPLKRVEGEKKDGSGSYDFFSCSGYPKCETTYQRKEDGTPNFDVKKRK